MKKYFKVYVLKIIWLAAIFMSFTAMVQAQKKGVILIDIKGKIITQI